MDYIKKLIGIVVGLFLVLVVAWFCSFSLKLDLNWYNTLSKPSFAVDGHVFAAFVSVVYFLHVVVISRLVTGKHLLPSMVFLGVIGLASILFNHTFFTLKNVYVGFIFILLTFVFSTVLQLRFLFKDRMLALYYLPIFVFNFYCLLVTGFIAFSN